MATKRKVKRDPISGVTDKEYERSVAECLLRLTRKHAAEVLCYEFGARRIAEVLARAVLDAEDASGRRDPYRSGQ